MMAVSFTNEVLEATEAKRRAWIDARFVNNAMMATLMGAAVSDGLEDGQAVGGAGGGQYTFVAQAFALDGARAILTVEATRQGKEGLDREYALDLRLPDHSAPPARMSPPPNTASRTWRGKRITTPIAIAAMLGIADSRFQNELSAQAKDAGKLSKNFEIPADNAKTIRSASASPCGRRARPAAIVSVR